MRRLGFLLATLLLVSGLSAPAYATRDDVPQLTLPGRTLINYGPAGGRELPGSAPTAFAPRTPSARSSTTPVGAFPTATSTLCALRPVSLPSALPWTRVCVHYQAGTASPVTPSAATPVFAAAVVAAFSSAEETYVRSGYKAPEADPATPGIMNVYLEDLATWADGQFKGAFGFTSAASNAGVHSGGDRAAFLVLDNDFACSQYDDACNNPHTPTQIMDVTVAHEFFHATQYAYNAYEDYWFMESTATWAETKVFPTVTDNLNYLLARSVGVLGAPNVPLDDNTGGAGGLGLYQNFLWWQFLGQTVPGTLGSMPTVVLNSWRYVDAIWGRPAYFSITAAQHALERSGRTLRASWRDFTAANVAPALTYANGATYPDSAPAVTIAAQPGTLTTRTGVRYVPHLASQTIKLTSASLPANQGVQLSVTVSNVRSATVTVVAYLRSGGRKVYALNLGTGSTTIKLGIGSSAIGALAITFANSGSTYARCGSQRYGYSCFGVPTVGNIGFTWKLSYFRS